MSNLIKNEPWSPSLKARLQLNTTYTDDMLISTNETILGSWLNILIIYFSKEAAMVSF